MSSESISPEFPFDSRWTEILGSKMHYIEEGEGETVLFLHGNPTSNYLWRNVIPHVSPHARCVAPDLIGMGKSDKPDIDYRFADHASYLDGFIDDVAPEGPVTLVLHDWGSGLGFHWAHRNPQRIRGLAFMEAIVRPAKWADFPPDYKMAFKIMRSPLGFVMISVFNQFVNKILPGATHRDLTDQEMRHYRAPYPTIASRKPIRQWPCEIPIEGEPADVHAIVSSYSAWLRKTEIPKLLLHAEPGGLIPQNVAAWCERNFPNLESVLVGKGVHYVQEDAPHRIGREIARWFNEL